MTSPGPWQIRTGVGFSRRYPRPERRPSWHVIGLLVALLVLVGCGEEAVGPGGTAVTIDGEKIAYDEVRAYAAESLSVGGEDLEQVSDPVWSALFDQFLDAQLLIRLAIERGLVDGEVDEARATLFLLRDADTEPSRAEIEAVYNSRRAEFEKPERVRLRQILVQERETALEAQDAIRSGESFVEVAARLSQGPTAHLGGDQGVLSREDLPPSFVDLIFSLEPGEMSGIVDSDYGFQIFLVEEKLAAEVQSLDDVLPTLREALQRRRIDEQMGSLLAEARERYRVTLYPSHIPFEYRGFYASNTAE